MDLRIRDKRALVLGSSQGLGFGVAEALAAEGVQVALNGRNADSLEAAVARLNEKGQGRAVGIVADLAKPESVDELIEGARDRLGGVDILVNNGGGPPPGPMTELTTELLGDNFDRMVTRLVELTTRLVPAMREQRWGRILTITSSGIIQPIPNLGLSNTLRAALVTWSKTLSDEIGPDGVTANILVPGRIHTTRVDQLDAGKAKRQGITPEEVAAASKASIPLRRYGAVEEFGAVAAFLCSEAASYVTGSVVRVDGGSIRSI